MSKLGKRLIYLSALCFVVLGLTGCTGGGASRSEDLVSVDELTADIQARFATADEVEYGESISVPRDHVFYFDLTQEAVEIFREITETPDVDGGWTNMVNVYRDSAFTQPVAFTVAGDEETYTYLTIGPPRQPVFYLTDNPQDLIDREVRDNWGNAGQYFLVQYYDFVTGGQLERPLVTIFNVEMEISGTPRVTFNMTEDGIAGLRWNEVPGAEEYLVIYIAESIDGSRTWRPMEFVTRTSETYWDDIEIIAGASRRNHSFRSFMDGDDSIDLVYELYRDLIESGQMTLEEFEALDYTFESQLLDTNNIYFAVVALNSEGNSAISNLIDLQSVAPRIPIQLSESMNEGGVIPSSDHPSSTIELEGDVLLAPTHAWVVMGDGSVASRLINYDIDAVIRGQITGYDVDGVHLVEEIANGSTLLVPYTIEGTHFTGIMQLVGYDSEGGTLEELAHRQDDLRGRGGDLERSVDLSAEIDEDDKGEVATELRGDFEPRSSSPLSAYLAVQMFNGQTRISLADFPQAADHEYLVEAWFEAVLQNPLVLGARSFQLDRLTGDLFVTYDQDASVQQRQQEAIMARVDEIVDEIITPGMTDLEMQTAINNFLIENATYDWGALDNAELNNFMFVDPEYYDSFTAYGILINGVGVCSGYADAFTLIADAAGLDSVIVTGFLQGSLPHAWNRVNIEGNWYTLDVTNNDNEHFPNAFFNLSDAEAATILTEDDQWRLNSQLSRYVARSSADSEFYRYNNLFFDQDEIVDALLESLLRDGEATYRTDVLLTDEQFFGIGEEVIRRGRLDPDTVFGGHFLGIIYLFVE